MGQQSVRAHIKRKRDFDAGEEGADDLIPTSNTSSFQTPQLTMEQALVQAEYDGDTIVHVENPQYEPGPLSIPMTEGRRIEMEMQVDRVIANPYENWHGPGVPLTEQTQDEQPPDQYPHSTFYPEPYHQATNRFGLVQYGTVQNHHRPGTFFDYSSNDTTSGDMDHWGNTHGGHNFYDE